jgi:hypothetical protein
MSEPTTAPATGTAQSTTQQAAQAASQQPEPANPPTGVTPEAWGALGDPGKAALTTEREARAIAEKANADLQARLDEIEKAQLSDLERAQAEAKTAQEAATKASTEALRYRLAATHGISTAPGPNGEPSDADTFLTASDETGMTAQAERLAARTGQAAAPTFPRADLTQGSGRDTANAAGPGSDFEKFIKAQLSD